VNHIVNLQGDRHLRAAYERADMVVVDGWPVLVASRVLGEHLPDLIPGSDLVPAVLSAAAKRESTKVFLLGAQEGIAVSAAARIGERYPWIEVCGAYSPPMGFSAETPASAQAIGLINRSSPDLLVIGLGSPKQEVWIHDVRDLLKVKVAICAGATIDFLAGSKKRAPLWIRKIRMEWFYRLIQEPGRLISRYGRDAFRFPLLLAREIFRRIRSKAF
jgi:N-acetylglucosaminyldiphosphoundecaprenol N-acetyl-beta-D-mannosaminyltransferase